MMKASDLLVWWLECEGITQVFGVPGEENADLMLSLGERLGNLQWTL
jgi:acetolactate synthase-1/2/3 large subunit